MGSRVRRSKCKHCNELYHKDARNVRHQKYCSKADCRKASKAASQRRWLSKKDNENHFRDADNARRVREWQQANPGYWRNKKRKRTRTLQEDLNTQDTDKQRDKETLNRSTLQDILITQPTVIVGLISTLTESTLQEDIASQVAYYHARGADILGTVPMKRMNSSNQNHEKENHPTTQSAAADPVPI